MYYLLSLYIYTQDGNVTVSILSLRVTSENDGAELICRAANPWFSNGALEDKRIISVACKCVVQMVIIKIFNVHKCDDSVIYCSHEKLFESSYK